MDSNVWRKVVAASTATPGRTRITRHVLTVMTVVAFAFALPIGMLGDGGGIFAVWLALVVCAYQMGFGPALIAPPVMLLSLRIRGQGFANLAPMSSQELLDLAVITLISGAVGWSGALRRRSQAIAKQRALQLVEQDRRKDEFLATLAHELRNPLAPIRTGLEILRMTGTNPPDPQTIHEVHLMLQRQIDHMVRLIDDLLDVSRINTGKIVVHRELVALSEVIQDAVESARPHIDAARLQLIVNQPEVDIQIEADRGRLAQVLLNLLNNAAKFTEPGGQILLSVTSISPQIEFRVRDSGIGIAPHMLPHIFEMFNQGEHLLTRAHGGLGIGLSLVRTLVDLHGGTVEAFSEGLGRGSEFVVRIPISNASGADASPGAIDACPAPAVVS